MMSAQTPHYPATRSEPPCGLYIHIPFCETKCGYCDFYSVALKGRNTAPLVDAVICEMELRLAASELPIRTIFCGGGTPTLLPIEQLERLLKAIGQQIDNRPRPAGISAVLRQSPIGNPLEEFTVEANPATVDDAKAGLLAASGVTRVSMGAQSFFPGELATLERLHSPEDIKPSVQILRRHGMRQINLDLIFGIPGQTLDTWRESLRRAIELGPDHIACYGLTFEPATRLTAQRSAGRITPCDEDLEADMFLTTIDVLASAGFRQYEISNYAKPGCECKHNLIYWRNQPYIGVGPSAAGCYEGSGNVKTSIRQNVKTRIEKSKSQKVETSSPPSEGWPEALVPSAGGLRRYKNVPDVAEYTRRMRGVRALAEPVAPLQNEALAGSGAPTPIAPGAGVLHLAEMEAEYIDADTLALEMILMQLRLNEGLGLADFRDRTGLDALRLFDPVLSRLVPHGSIEVSSHIALTRDGRLIANRVINELAACVESSKPLAVL